MRGWLLALWLGGLLTLPAHAQLARSFYNITAIRTRILSNAIQIVIQTDGNVAFGVDAVEIADTNSENFAPRPVASLRLRLLGARAKVPAFTDISSYPVDAAVITVGNDLFKLPFFNNDGYALLNDPTAPRTDVELRFFLPIAFRDFNLDASSSEERGSGSVLGPLEGSLSLSPDRRAILITILTDRVETYNLDERLKRSSAAAQTHRLAVERAPAGALSVDVLHTPLVAVAAKLGEVSGVPLAVQPDAGAVDVSVHLPDTNLKSVLKALEIGYGLGIVPRPEGGFLLGRSGGVVTTEYLPLRYLDPRRARLLLPDFLLPSLRADLEANALVVTGTAAVVARVKADLARLDRPQPLVRISATAYEIATTSELLHALESNVASDDRRVGLVSEEATLTLHLESGQRKSFQMAVDALSRRGRARVASQSVVLVASGTEGKVALGQDRYVKVIRLRFGQAQVEALRVAVGANLAVTPVVGEGGDVTLSVQPRISTVDALDAATGLPTLGLREARATLRLRPGQSALVACLDATGGSQNRRDLAPLARTPFSSLFGSRSKDSRETALLWLVSAAIVPTSSPQEVSR